MNSSARLCFAGLAGLLVLAALPACSRSADATKDAPVAVKAPAPPSPSIPAPVPAAGKNERHRAALETARDSGDPRRRASEFGRLLREWIQEDPEAALAYVRQLAPGADYTQGLLLVLEAMGQTDPARALALARDLVTTRDQRAIYHSLFARLAATDPAGAVAQLALVPAGESRDRALRALADGWAGSDLPAALAWAQKLDPVDRAPALEAVLAALTPTDPLRALDLARQTLAGPALDRTVTAALQALTLSDPRAAAAIVSVLAPGDTQTAAAFNVARALAAQNPAEALAWITTLPTGRVQDLVLNNVLEVWSQKDLAAAGRYVAQMPPGPAQEAAAEHVARLLAAADPAAALAWAQALGSETARSRALISVSSAWAQHDPAAAARWAAASGTPAEALAGALSYWMLLDAGAARDFVSGLAGETQVRAAACIAPTLAQADPAQAVAWSQTLASPAAREAALAAAFARWQANAPAAARAWLVAAELSPPLKARLLGRQP